MYLFMYSFFFFILTSTCFGCYLYPSSGAQLQRAAIGVSVEGRGYNSIKRCGVMYILHELVVLCVLINQSYRK
jgi:hypothetical protein